MYKSVPRGIIWSSNLFIYSSFVSFTFSSYTCLYYVEGSRLTPLRLWNKLFMNSLIRPFIHSFIYPIIHQSFIQILSPFIHLSRSKCSFEWNHMNSKWQFLSQKITISSFHSIDGISPFGPLVQPRVDGAFVHDVSIASAH